MKRVVVTGMAGITSLGSDWASIESALRAGNNGIVTMDEWDRFEGLNTRLAGPVTDFSTPAYYGRKRLRTMGRVSKMSVRASELALEDAGLLDDPVVSDGSTGVSYGSSAGSTDAVSEFGAMLLSDSARSINATSYIRMMGHTAPVNVGLFFKAKGRIITTSSACTSGSQGIGYAYEAIRWGQQAVMIAGGAEELCPTESAVFDVLFATSTKNNTPKCTPRPFDRDRDGLVIGEGAGTLILEELEHAKARGAKIYAEIIGFGTNSDGSHVTHPESETMARAMTLALEQARISAEDVDYVSAHGTATEAGDIAETIATEKVFGPKQPISSLKSYFGHTLGACGAIEAWLTIKMMCEGWFAPTINLENVDPSCGSLDYIVGDGRDMDNEIVVSNNFAFGGINTSLVFKRWC